MGGAENSLPFGAQVRPHLRPLARRSGAAAAGGKSPLRLAFLAAAGRPRAGARISAALHPW
jgi:hypothetical protein